MDKSHTIYRFPVHTPNGQTVDFQLNMANIREALDAARCTLLTEYFTLKARDRKARDLFCLQIPTHYIWIARDKRWKERDRRADKVESRMYHVTNRRAFLCAFFISARQRSPFIRRA